MVTWTDLHAALGETPGPLAFDMVRRAVEAKVAETGGLDWKRAVPAEDKDQAWYEPGKDIAAMANSGGGLIVYGVDEVRGKDSSTASRIVSVGQITDSMEKKIRVAALRWPAPPITNLEIIPLSSADSTQQVLAVWVPDSQEAPHLVIQKLGQSWFGAPYRIGRNSAWMDERQLERAYWQRFAGRERRVHERVEIWDRFVDQLNAARGHAWIVLVATPTVQLPPAAIARNHLAEVLRDAIKSPSQSAGGPAWGPVQEAQAFGRDRPGLRSAVLVSDRQPYSGRVEVALDGTLALGLTRVRRTQDGLLFPDTEVSMVDLEQTCLDAHHLLTGLAPAGIVRGDYVVQLDIVTATQQRPTILVAEFGRERPFEHAGAFHRLEAFLPVSAGVDASREALEQLRDDVYNQVGLNRRP